MFKQVVDTYVLKVHSTQNKFPDVPEITLKEFIEYYISRIDHVMSAIPVYETENINRYYFNLLYEATRHYKGFSNQIVNVFEKDLLMWENVVEKAQQNGELRNDLDIHKVAKHFRMIYSGLSFERSLNNGLNTSELKEMFN
ncbi:MAG: hypothetical protein LUD02_09965 [Tannerellaceae bacterium]|nr:hypothetical protein [Tannerellaceae bacterium]